MEEMLHASIPREALSRLEFLIGDYAGEMILSPPGERPSRFQAAINIKREACDRFFQIDYVADSPQRGVDSLTAFLTYSSRRGCYEMWVFSCLSEEPLHMVGGFEGRKLVMVSDPWPMTWGLQRLRSTFMPTGEGSLEYVSELWEPDGYRRFRSAAFRKVPVPA
jgi:hypothetical protein